MINQELIQLIEAVDNINNDIVVQSPDHVADVICESLYGDIWIVKFAGVVIYDEDNEEREWIEEVREEHEDGSDRWRMIPAHYEPIEQYLRKKINELVTKIGKIKL